MMEHLIRSSIWQKIPEFKALCDLLGEALRRDPRNRISISDMQQRLSQLAPQYQNKPWPLALS